MASVTNEGISMQHRRNDDNYGQNRIIRRSRCLSATFPPDITNVTSLFETRACVMVDRRLTAFEKTRSWTFTLVVYYHYYLSSSPHALFTLSERAIQFVYRTPSILRLQLHTSTFLRSTINTSDSIQILLQNYKRRKKPAANFETSTKRKLIKCGEKILLRFLLNSGNVINKSCIRRIRKC
jgi:hypothetical protein